MDGDKHGLSRSEVGKTTLMVGDVLDYRGFYWEKSINGLLIHAERAKYVTCRGNVLYCTCTFRM